MQPQLPPHVAKNIDGFTGRRWLLPALLEWWDRAEERLFLLTGGPGTGKSMIMAWLAGYGPEPADGTARVQLARLRQQVKAAHFCQADSRNISPQAFAESIANQLSAGTPGFADALKATLADLAQFNVIQNVGSVAADGTVIGFIVDLGTLGDERSFDRALVRPLKQLYGTGYAEPMLLLVDALDEAQTYGGGKTLSSLLARIADLPKPVHILATSRDDPRVLKSFRNIEPFDLIKDAPANVDDVRSYSEGRLAGVAAADDAKCRDFAARLAEQAGGVFLYAAMVLDELLPPAQWPDLSTYPLPDGLSGLYHDFLERELGEDEHLWFDVYEPLLGMIAVAQGQGLTARQLTDVVGRDIRKALRVSKQYLSGELLEGPFRPFHKSFADFLLEEEDNIDFHIDATAMHRRIAERFLAEHRDRSLAEARPTPNPPSRAEGQAPGDEADDGYVVDWLPYHLARAGLVEELHGLQFDLPWLRRKLTARDTTALIKDTKLCPGDAEIDRLGRALRLSANVLKRDRRQLEAQLLGRLLRKDGRRITDLLETAAREIPPGVMVPRGGGQLRPPGPLLSTLAGHSDRVYGAVLLEGGKQALSWSGDNTLRLWDLESGESRALAGHVGGVSGAVLLEGGKQALSWSEDHTLRLWNLESGKSRELAGHGGAVSGALLLEGGKQALSWSYDCTLRLWDLETGAELRRLDGHEDKIHSVALLPDGRHALSGSSDKTLRLWDLESGESRALAGHGGAVLGAVLLEGGKQALSWSGDGTLRLWDLESGESRALAGHRGVVSGAVLLAGGKQALSWSRDSTLRLWDLESGESRALEGHGGEVSGAVRLAGGKQALSWSRDGTLRLWDLESGESRALEGHSNAVFGALLLEGGKQALSWSRDNTLRLWDLESGESRALEGHSSWVEGAVLLEGGKQALSWSWDNTLRLWDLESGESRALAGDSGVVFGALLLEGGKQALSWSHRSTLRLWDLESGESRALAGHGGMVLGAVLLEGGKQALSWSRDGTLRLWDLESGESRALAGHGGEVSGAVRLAGGKRALSWSRDNTLRLWDLESGESQALEGHSNAVFGALLLEGGKQALSWSHGSKLRLWDLESGESRALEGHSNAVFGALLLEGGKQALSWSGDNTLRLWDLESGESRALEGHSSWVEGAVLLAGGKQALSWSHGSTLRLWDLESGESRELAGHSDRVSGAVLLEGGKQALSWSRDGTLRLWDLESGESRALAGHGGVVYGAVQLAGGKHALSWSRDNTLRLWDLDELQEIACAWGDNNFTTCVVDENRRLAVVGDERGQVLFFDISDLANV